MSLDASAIEKIERLSKIEVFTDEHGLERATKTADILMPPRPSYLTVHSLSAIITYLNENEYLDKNKKLIVHVIDECNVAVLSPLDEKLRIRENYLAASAEDSMFRFGKFYPVEEFIIAMQALFVQNDHAKQILRVVGNITEEAEHKTMDDGVSQAVTAKVGIAKTANVELPNPVRLRPFRTFSEVEQPASLFVLRIKKSGEGQKGPSCALFEADGGLWKIAAINTIAKSLAEALPEDTVILA